MGKGGKRAKSRSGRGQGGSSAAGGSGAGSARGRSGAGARGSRLLLVAGAFGAVFLLVLGWLWLGGGSTTFRGNTSSYNVLLITMDTTRADRLGCYGHGEIRTPILDGLADRGVLFENAYSPAVMTLPSHTTIMSGHLPPVHGVRINGSSLVRPEVETLAEILRAAGYRTGAAVSAVVLDSMFGLNQGFEHYDDNLPESGPHDVFFAQRPAGAVTDAALAWLGTTASTGRWFLWAHYFDPHTPFSPPSPYKEQYGPRSYDGEIAYMDAEIGRLLAGIDELGASDRTIVIAVGDHGEGLRDHGEMTHGVFLYDETARVPFIMTVPGFVEGGRRVPGVVRTTDILPTVLDLLRLPGRPAVDGVTLWPMLSGASEDLDLAAYSESAASALMYGWSPLAAVRSGPWKYIHGPKAELYNLEADPGERTNLLEVERATADELRERLRGLLGGLQGLEGEATVDLSPEQEARLRSLGYTGGAGGEFRESLERDPAAIMAGATYGLPDPKDRLVALDRINRISTAYGSGEFRAAASLAQEFLVDEPDNVSVRQFLADSYRGLEMYDEALSEYRTILSETPENVDVLLNIGWVLSKMGDLRAAKATYERALALHPGHIFALSSLGNLHYAEGDYATAVSYYRKVILERPTHWKSIVAMARIFQETGKTHEAKVFFQRAVEVNPRDLDSYLALGWLQFVDGELEEALQTLTTAGATFPGLPEVDLSRGDVLFALGRMDEAESAYREGLKRAPRAAQGYHGLGRIAASRGDVEAARRFLQQAIEINPGYRAAREELLRLESGGS